jgi:hypothetical protein
MQEDGLAIKHPKRRGEWAEMRFTARAAENGLTVTKPWGDSTRYDFIVESEGCMLRVQVKSTLHEIEGGGYRCGVLTSHGPYQHNQIDYIAAYIIQLDLWYIIPADAAVLGQRTVSFFPRSQHSRYNVYKEAWHLLKQKRCAGNARECDLCLRHGCQARLREAPVPETPNP